jgi:hypothetical protein
MIVVALVLFLGGMWLLGFSFTLPDWQGLVFVAGILCVALSLALPIHLTRRALGVGEDREY